jgi:hypothetical protein
MTAVFLNVRNTTHDQTEKSLNQRVPVLSPELQLLVRTK